MPKLSGLHNLVQQPTRQDQKVGVSICVEYWNNTLNVELRKYQIQGQVELCDSSFLLTLPAVTGVALEGILKKVFLSETIISMGRSLGDGLGPHRLEHSLQRKERGTPQET